MKWDIWNSFMIGRRNRAALKEMEYNRKLTELGDFCPIGDRFQYLGVTMLCIQHEWSEPDGGQFIGIMARYVNNHGELETKLFQYCQLPILIKENERE